MYTRAWLPEVMNSFDHNTNMSKTNTTAPAINVMESETEYKIELAVPGMRKEDFDIKINADGDLTIEMENRHGANEEENNNGRYLRREFAYNRFKQTMIIPDDVDKELIAARITDGILTVTLSKIVKEEKKTARQIQIS